MSFLDRGKKRVPEHASFRITQEGREKLNDFNADPKSRILVALENSSGNVDDISRDTGMSRGQVENNVMQLVRGGYVQYIHSGSYEEL